MSATSLAFHNIPCECKHQYDYVSLPQTFCARQNKSTMHCWCAPSPGILFWNMVLWPQSAFAFLGFPKPSLEKGARIIWGSESALRWGQGFTTHAGHLKPISAFGTAHHRALWPLHYYCRPVSFPICPRGPRTQSEGSCSCLSLAPASSPLCLPWWLRRPLERSFTGDTENCIVQGWSESLTVCPLSQEDLESFCSFLWRRERTLPCVGHDVGSVQRPQCLIREAKGSLFIFFVSLGCQIFGWFCPWAWKVNVTHEAA